jgi:hypothetical protein
VHLTREALDEHGNTDTGNVNIIHASVCTTEVVTLRFLEKLGVPAQPSARADIKLAGHKASGSREECDRRGELRVEETLLAIVIRITTYKRLAEPDTLGRTWAGYYPGITEQDAFDAARGVWTLAPAADAERFAIIVGGGKGTGTVLAVAEIDMIEDDPLTTGKRVLAGRVLGAGHPVRDAYLGKPDPSGSTSQNAIAYVRDLPEECPFVLRPCRCGCGADVRRAFAPGHDQRAIRDVIARNFNGSTVRFLDWMDDNGPAAGRVSATVI